MLIKSLTYHNKPFKILILKFIAVFILACFSFNLHQSFSFDKSEIVELTNQEVDKGIDDSEEEEELEENQLDIDDLLNTFDNKFYNSKTDASLNRKNRADYYLALFLSIPTPPPDL